MTTTQSAYLITKTDAGHGESPVDVVGIFRCSYEQAQEIVEKDRAEEKARLTAQWEKHLKAQGRHSLESYLGNKEEDYTISPQTITDLGGRDDHDEDQSEYGEDYDGGQ
jgi:hypothetical protein